MNCKCHFASYCGCINFSMDARICAVDFIIYALDDGDGNGNGSGDIKGGNGEIDW